jgi:hypothetical protein
MPQVTLSVPEKKLPLFKNLLSALGITTSKSGKNFLRKMEYKSNSSASHANSSNSFFSKHPGWEYFSNELEFE